MILLGWPQIQPDTRRSPEGLGASRAPQNIYECPINPLQGLSSRHLGSIHPPAFFDKWMSKQKRASSGDLPRLQPLRRCDEARPRRRGQDERIPFIPLDWEHHRLVQGRFQQSDIPDSGSPSQFLNRFGVQIYRFPDGDKIKAGLFCKKRLS